MTPLALRMRCPVHVPLCLSYAVSASSSSGNAVSAYLAQNLMRCRWNIVPQLCTSLLFTLKSTVQVDHDKRLIRLLLSLGEGLKAIEMIAQKSQNPNPAKNPERKFSSFALCPACYHLYLSDQAFDFPFVPVIIAATSLACGLALPY
nr:hypothetical protein CFP56_78029 [Quercus suber]